VVLVLATHVAAFFRKVPPAHLSVGFARLLTRVVLAIATTHARTRVPLTAGRFLTLRGFVQELQVAFFCALLAVWLRRYPIAEVVSIACRVVLVLAASVLALLAAVIPLALVVGRAIVGRLVAVHALQLTFALVELTHARCPTLQLRIDLIAHLVALVGILIPNALGI